MKFMNNDWGYCKILPSKSKAISWHHCQTSIPPTNLHYNPKLIEISICLTWCLRDHLKLTISIIIYHILYKGKVKKNVEISTKEGGQTHSTLFRCKESLLESMSVHLSVSNTEILYHMIDRRCQLNIEII